MERKTLQLFLKDIERYSAANSRIVFSPALRFIWVLRRRQRRDNFLLRIAHRYMQNKYGLEIFPETSIGGGLYLGHAFNITVNPAATIGSNCNIHKGVTIGQENRGKRKGAPRIGNNVWMGANSTIVGKIEIGDDVLIAPNTYVNCDIPSHSVVFGNPCVIKHRDNATEGYINSKVSLSD